MEIKRLPRAEFDYIYSKVPRLCVDLVITSDKGILLTLRDMEPYKGQWHTPGGTVLMGEKVAEAAKRIAKEELGVQIEIENQPIGIMEFPVLEVYRRQDMSLVYRAKILKGEIQTDSQASNYRYFGDLPENTIQVQKKFLKRHLKLK